VRQFRIVDFGLWIGLMAIVIVVFASLVVPRATGAQPPGRVARIGVLHSGSPSSAAPSEDAFRQALRELGYIQGQNILLEHRFAEGKSEKLSELAAELVLLKVDILVVGGVSATQAARQATTTVPIVVGYAGDLVGTGLVASLAKPGGNVTGSTEISPDLSGKRLELVKEVVPRASRVGVVWYPRKGGSDEEEVRQTETAARQLGVQVQLIEVQQPNEFQGAYTAMTKQQANAVILIRGSFTDFHRTQLIGLALKHRLPSICEPAQWVHDGCLMSYGPDYAHLWRRTAVYVDKILKGAKPADLPVEQPTKFELVVNLRIARALGLTLPQSILLRADEVIR
jgi:putative ABC transport system substrate-binding protein